MNKIEFINVTKRFGNLVANDNINFNVKEGEVHALLGENGAGKSTLMSILFGLYTPTTGHIKINGEEVRIKDPREANKLKIAMLPQHFKLVENMSVLENIMLGYEMTKGGLLNKQAAKEKIEAAKEKYGIEINLNARVGALPVSDKQKVELLKILWGEADIMIFDEPTSILTPVEIEQFLKLILDLKRAGKTILMITHKLPEIKAVADRVTIIRKGAYIDTVNAATATEKELADLMVGKAVDLNLSTIQKDPVNKELTTLRVQGLNYKGKGFEKSLNDLDFHIQSGEILGIAAIDGNGQSELMEILGGVRKAHSGKVEIADHETTNIKSSKLYYSNEDYTNKDTVLRVKKLKEKFVSGVYGKVTKEASKKSFDEQLRISKELAEQQIEAFEAKNKNATRKVTKLRGQKQKHLDTIVELKIDRTLEGRLVNRNKKLADKIASLEADEVNDKFGKITKLREKIEANNVKIKEIILASDYDQRNNERMERFDAKIAMHEEAAKDLQERIAALVNLSYNEGDYYWSKKTSLLSHIPEDRHKHGLILDYSVAKNAILQDLKYFSRFGILDTTNMRRRLDMIQEKYDVRGIQSHRTPARALSGGNQQKLILGREIERGSDVLLAVHPTRGLDVGAIRNVYEKIVESRNQGTAVLLSSGELDEIMQVSDRIMVLYEGKIVSITKRGELSKLQLGALMSTGEVASIKKLSVRRATVIKKTTVVEKTTVKKAAPKKKATKKAVAKKPAAKKAPVKKAAPKKKAVAKKAPAKKASTKEVTKYIRKDTDGKWAVSSTKTGKALRKASTRKEAIALAGTYKDVTHIEYKSGSKWVSVHGAQVKTANKTRLSAEDKLVKGGK